MDAGAVVVFMEFRKLVRCCPDQLLLSRDSDAPLRLALAWPWCRALTGRVLLLRQVVAWFLVRHGTRTRVGTSASVRSHSQCVHGLHRSDPEVQTVTNKQDRRSLTLPTFCWLTTAARLSASNLMALTSMAVVSNRSRRTVAAANDMEVLICVVEIDCEEALAFTPQLSWNAAQELARNRQSGLNYLV